MNETLLNAFRSISESMQTEPTNWQWIGKHMSQRMFGITETRAKAYAKRHGGEAKQMDFSEAYYANEKYYSGITQENRDM